MRPHSPRGSGERMRERGRLAEESRAAGAAPASPARRLRAARSPRRAPRRRRPRRRRRRAREHPRPVAGPFASASARSAAAAAVARVDRRAHGPGQEAQPRSASVAARRPPPGGTRAGRRRACRAPALSGRHSNSGHGFAASSSLGGAERSQRRVLPPEAHERDAPRMLDVRGARDPSSARARPGAGRSRRDLLARGIEHVGRVFAVGPEQDLLARDGRVQPALEADPASARSSAPAS